MFGLLPVFAVFFLNESLAKLGRWNVGLAAGTMLWAACARRILVGMPEGPALFGAGDGGSWVVGVVLDGPAVGALPFLEASAGLSRLVRGGPSGTYNLIRERGGYEPDSPVAANETSGDDRLASDSEPEKRDPA